MSFKDVRDLIRGSLVNTMALVREAYVEFFHSLFII